MNKKVFALALVVALMSGGYSALKHRGIASTQTQIAPAATFSEFSKLIIHNFPEVKTTFLENIEVYMARNDAALEKLAGKKVPAYEKRAALSALIYATLHSLDLQKAYLTLASEDLLLDLKVSLKLMDNYHDRNRFDLAAARIKAVNKQLDEIAAQVKGL